MLYQVRRSPYFDKRFRQADGDVRRILEKVLESLTHPEIATHSGHALQGDLSQVRRVKRGRLRIFYLASEARETVIVLYVGVRREGEKKDAYEELRALLDKGAFEPQFKELEIAI